MPGSGLSEMSAIAARIVQQNTWFHCTGGIAPIGMRVVVCGNDCFHTAENGKRKIRQEYVTHYDNKPHARWLDELADVHAFKLPEAFNKGPDSDVKGENFTVNFRYCVQQLVDALSRCYLGRLEAPGSSRDWGYPPNSQQAEVFDNMMDMLRVSANEKGLLVFNMYTMINQAANTDAMDGRQHFNERGKPLIA